MKKFIRTEHYSLQETLSILDISNSSFYRLKYQYQFNDVPEVVHVDRRGKHYYKKIDIHKFKDSSDFIKWNKKHYNEPHPDRVA